MRYLPQTREDIEKMLKVVGVDSLDGLFSGIPEDCRRKQDLNLPEPLTEWELNRRIDEMAGSMAVGSEYKVFMGAGSYHHYIPEVVRQLINRSEVYTAYTPYQPEISQGTLQAIYEYQTLVTRLLGMEVANASMYDGASSLAEALLMAIRITRRKKVAVSTAIHPLHRRVVRTYFAPTGYEVMEIPFLPDGRTDLSRLENLEELAGVAVQSPNFFGCIEDLKAVGDRVHTDDKTLFVAAFTEPLAYGVLKRPGDCGADIACGEGQSFGIPQSFGGPGLGMFTAQKKYVRNMPGRLIGKTVDRDGRTGFVLTLATREQHIRRERATSNICSNQGLCATASVMYMASLGGTGIRELAKLNHDKAAYFKSAFQKAGLTIPFESPVFNEFVVKFPERFKDTHARPLEKKIVAGPVCVTRELERFLPVPRVVKHKDGYELCEDYPESVGKVHAFYGNFSVLIKAYSYILSMGPDLKKASQYAVLNANYIRENLKGVFHLPYDRPCMHECVFTDEHRQKFKIATLDIAKRLMDYGFHPPTVYFPLVVSGAIMIEPTESESRETIDQFIEAMKSIAQEARELPELLHDAPQNPKVQRLDETLAARTPCLTD